MDTTPLLRIAAETTFQGIPIVIEHPKGSTRTGINADGEAWEREMHAAYGYVPDTRSKGDNEDLDVYVGPDAESPTAYCINQLKEDGSFDEVKVMLGFTDEQAALTCYLKHYPEDWASRVGGAVPLPVSRLRELVEEERGKRVGPKPKAAVLLCVTDPASGKRVALADLVRRGFEASPEVRGPSRYLRMHEVRQYAGNGA